VKVLGRDNGVVWVLLAIIFQRLLVVVLVFDVTVWGCVRAAECNGGSCFCGSLR